MKPGIHFGVPFADYKALQAANKSGLDLIARSPKHFKELTESKVTPARLLGSQIHTAILEPLEFSNRYVVLEDDAPRKPTRAQIKAKKPSIDSIVSIEYWEAFEKRAEGREIISCDTFEQCFNIANNLNQKPQAKEFLNSGKPEVTLVWERDQVSCKARVDWLTEGAILDIKSTEDASRDSFIRDIYKYGYHRQAAWYLDGYRALTGEDVLFVIAAVEKSKPFESNFFFMPEEAVHVGRLENDKAFERYRQARESDDWPGYQAELIRADMPAWLMKKAGEL